jgi:superfamily II DNA or RNA helicase
MTLQLRDYQRDFFQRVRERYDAGVTRQLGVLATGLGKAVLFAALREQMNFGKKIMVLVHREELAAQAADKLWRWNQHLHVGVEMADRYADVDGIFPATLIVASVPTLGRRGSRRIAKFLPEDFDCIVSDEAHHSSSPQWRNVLTHFGLTEPGGSILSLGLTATPNRSDGTGLRQNFDEIVFDMGIREGIQSGYLVDLRGIRVNTKTNLDKVKTRAGDFAEDELANAVNTVERNAIIVKEWMAAAFDLKTVVFTVDIQHAMDLAAAFSKCGVPAEAVWGADPDRKVKLHKHRSGQVPVLCNCAVLTEGYDDPGIRCIVLAKPTKSALLFTQMIGRGTRIDDGKPDCIIMDVVDNTKKHSVVTVPSLLGLPAQLDLKGKSVIQAKERFERVAKEFPIADLSAITSLSKLDSVAENISLFQVHYPPEISRLSELGWRKNGDGYILAMKRDLITITKDLRDEYKIVGNLEGQVVTLTAQNLPGAFSIGDSLVSREFINVLKRDARWHGERPTEKQLGLCRILGIQVPNGATRGQVSAAIDAKRSMMRHA